MSQYYQFNDAIDKSSSPAESSEMRRHKDVIWQRRDFLKLKLLREGQLNVLYFFSHISLVCVAHFTKLFYLDIGLSVTQISVLQCIFYLTRYYGWCIIVYINDRIHRNGGEKNTCLRRMRTIIISSVCASTVLWLLLVLPEVQNFEILVGLVFVASLTISTSHGFLDMVAEDTIRNTKTKIDYAKIRFWGLLAWGLGSIGIGALADAVNINMIFYMFAAFQIIFNSCLFCWFPERHASKKTQRSTRWQNMCSGGGMFNVYFFIFLFGMVNALPEILMLHLKLKFDIKALFLGILISAMSFGEMFGYLMISICNCGLRSFSMIGILAIVFTGVRLSFWANLTSEYLFLLSEFVEFSLVAIFWVSTLQMVKSITTFLPGIQQDLQNLYHYQSLGCGVLLYGTLYDYAGAEQCFQVAAGMSVILLLYFFLTFSCTEKRGAFNEEDSLLNTTEDDEEAQDYNQSTDFQEKVEKEVQKEYQRTATRIFESDNEEEESETQDEETHDEDEETHDEDEETQDKESFSATQDEESFAETQDSVESQDREEDSGTLLKTQSGDKNVETDRSPENMRDIFEDSQSAQQ